MKNHRHLKNSRIFKISALCVLALVAVPMLIAASTSPVEAGASLLCAGSIGSIIPGFGSKSADIAELQTKLTAAEGQVSALETEKAASLVATADLQTKLTAAETLAADLQTKLTAAETAATAAKTKFDTDLKAATDSHAAALKAEQDARETKINAEVTTRLASAGVDPLAPDKNAKQQGDPGAPPAPPDLKGKSAAELIHIGLKQHLGTKQAAA